MLKAYRDHVAERAALGIPPLPLDAKQVAALIELIKSPQAGEAEFLMDLLTHRVPPGVDDAAKVKASFLSAVAHGDRLALHCAIGEHGGLAHLHLVGPELVEHQRYRPRQRGEALGGLRAVRDVEGQGHAGLLARSAHHHGVLATGEVAQVVGVHAQQQRQLAGEGLDLSDSSDLEEFQQEVIDALEAMCS
jgi:hypothetical protein